MLKIHRSTEEMSKIILQKIKFKQPQGKPSNKSVKSDYHKVLWFKGKASFVYEKLGENSDKNLVGMPVALKNSGLPKNYKVDGND